MKLIKLKQQQKASGKCWKHIKTMLCVLWCTLVAHCIALATLGAHRLHARHQILSTNWTHIWCRLGTGWGHVRGAWCTSWTYTVIRISSG